MTTAPGSARTLFMNLNDIPQEVLTAGGIYEITDGPLKGNLGVFIGDISFNKKEDRIEALLEDVPFKGVEGLDGTPGLDVRWLRYRGYVGGPANKQVWADKRP